MNFNTLKKNYKVRYNTNISPKCTFAGSPLYILGDITANCGFSSLLTTLSAGTAIALDSSDNDVFSIQKNDDNVLFSCKTSNLQSYTEDNYTKNIFITLGYFIDSLNKNINGLNILYENSTTQKQFHNYLSPLFAMLFSEHQTKIPTQLLSLKIPEKELRGIFTSLISHKNACTLIKNNISDYQLLPLPVSDKKIIIIKLDEKNQYLSQQLLNAVISYNNHSSEDFSTSIDYDNLLNSTLPLTKKEKMFLCFTLNEEKRIEKYTQISDLHDFCKIINESSSEILKLLNNNNFNILANILSISGHVLTFRPIPDTSSMYCIVYNELVDDFINFCEKEYEKKAGYKPTFYICNTVTGALNREIIH